MNGQANDILRQYQEQASEGSLKFRRWPLRSVSCIEYTLRQLLIAAL